MNRSNSTNRSGGVYGRVADSIAVKCGTVVVVVVVLLMVSSAGIGGVASATAQQGGNDTKSFAVKQGDNCYTVTPLGNGTENVVSFYNYRSHGSGYSSRGTTDLQVPDTSQMFFYQGNGGLSLVMLHDQWSGNGSTTGGAVTLEMHGLPVTGGWAVQDDGYPGSNDSFRFNESKSTASWTWGPGRSDGGVYQASPSAWNSQVRIKPQFNRNAELYPNPAWDGASTAHQIQRWIIRSGDGKAHALNMYEEVKIQPGTCANMGGSNQGSSSSSGAASSGQQDTGGNSGMATDGGSSQGTAATGPGFGIALTLLALAVALIAISRRRR